MCLNMPKATAHVAGECFANFCTETHFYERLGGIGIHQISPEMIDPLLMKPLLIILHCDIPDKQIDYLIYIAGFDSFMDILELFFAFPAIFGVKIGPNTNKFMWRFFNFYHSKLPQKPRNFLQCV